MPIDPLLPSGDLDRYSVEAGTDKSSRGHDYMRLYEFVFAPYRTADFCFMELGVGLPRIKAASLRTWRQYFTNARIIGVDNNPKTQQFSGDDFEVEIGNAAKPLFLNQLVQKHQPAIILDDASHKWSHQITAFRTLFPLLPPNGIYVIEDIFTSFPMPEKYEVYADHPESTWNFVSRLQAALAGAQTDWPPISAEESEIVAWIDAILLTRKTVIFIKRAEPHPSEVERAAELRARQGEQSG
ncbi:hypothetical protein J3R80_10555 [Aliiroseovarius sp. Z3]|uniref:hypothetical protein n=1 Tax=Aliiroseovarius sp. Z3 TaxID=2811402 RepID=UPI0023B2EEC7|nr:hypothetical protein [Aliiroseovarius sp. Z3]MDE9450906.1 hypothetical protein [Aliiroseovarius sp. Z3]